MKLHKDVQYDSRHGGWESCMTCEFFEEKLGHEIAQGCAISYRLALRHKFAYTAL